MTKARDFPSFVPTNFEILSGGVKAICEVYFLTRGHSRFHLSLIDLDLDTRCAFRRHLQALVRVENRIALEGSGLFYTVIQDATGFFFEQLLDKEGLEKKDLAAQPAPAPLPGRRTPLKTGYVSPGKAGRLKKKRSSRRKRVPKEKPTPPNGKGKLVRKKGEPPKKARESCGDATAARHHRK